MTAAAVGYESEAAFNRAFKRVTGTTPGRWRDELKKAPPYVPGPQLPAESRANGPP